MGIIGKVTPKIYEYLRFAGKSSVLEVKSLSRVNASGLKYNANFAQSLKYKPEEISSAYREYAKVRTSRYCCHKPFYDRHR